MSTPIVFRYQGDLRDLRKDNREAERIVSGMMDFVGGTLGGIGQRVATQMKSMSRGLSQSFAAMGKFSTVAFGGILAGVTAVTAGFVALRTAVSLLTGTMRIFSQVAQVAGQVIVEVSQRIYQAIDAFGQFDTQVRQTATLLPSETDKIVGELAKVSRALVDEFNLDPLDVATAQYKTVSAVILEGTDKFLESSFKFARAGKTTADIAIALGTRFISTFQESGDAAEAFYDKVLTAVRFGILTPEEMALNLPELLPLGKAYNIDVEETLSALSTLTRQTGDAAKATTQLTTLINNLVVETRPAGRFFKEQFGKSLPQFLAEGGRFIEGIDMIKRKADELGISIGTALGGRKEAQLAAVGLTQGRAIFDEIFSYMIDSAGELERMFGVATGGIGFQLDNLRTEFELLKLSIGQLFSPVVGVFSDALVWVIDTIQKVFDPSAWDPKAIISGLEDVGEWFKTLGARMWGWVQTGADYLWGLGQSIVRFVWEGFNAEGGVANWGQSLMQRISDGMGAWFDEAGTFFDAMQTKIAAWLGLEEGADWDTIGVRIASLIWTGVKNNLVPFFSGLGGELRNAFTSSELNQTEIEKMANHTYNWYKEELSKHGQAYMREKYGEDLYNAFYGSLLNRQFGMEIGTNLHNWVKDQYGIKSKSWMQELGESLYNFFISTEDNKLNVWNIGSLIGGWVWDKVTELGTKFLNFGAQIWNWVFGVGGEENRRNISNIGTETGNIFTSFFYSVVQVISDLGVHLAALITGNGQTSKVLGSVGAALGNILWSAFTGLVGFVAGLLPGDIGTILSSADMTNLQKVGTYMGELVGYAIRKAIAAALRGIMRGGGWDALSVAVPPIAIIRSALSTLAGVVEPSGLPQPPALATDPYGVGDIWTRFQKGQLTADQTRQLLGIGTGEEGESFMEMVRRQLGLDEVTGWEPPPLGYW